MESLQLELVRLADTERLGSLLGLLARPGDTICLDGDLGAGKTTLAQAIARGLEVPEECYVTSPSFAILHEYAGRIAMYHMDFYRLQSAVEVLDMGLEEYFFLSGLTVIEWSKRAETLLPEERLSLELRLNNDMSRTVTITATADYLDTLQRIRKEFQCHTPTERS